MSTTQYARQAYEVLFGTVPPESMPREDCVDAVMSEWDGRRFDDDHDRRRIGRLALCEIGLWYGDRDPVALELVRGRLSELGPWVGAPAFDSAWMERVLVAAYSSR